MTGPELRRIRHEMGLTLKALAARFPVHWRTLLKWERSERQMSPMAIKTIERIRAENATSADSA